MTFAEFQSKSFPEKSVFERKQFDAVTNGVKWIALRIAYPLFKAGVTANVLDVAWMFLAVGAFALLATAVQGHRLLPLLGIPILYVHILIDFIDGAIAKAHGTCSKIGHYLDSLGCDADRFALVVLFGVYSGSTFLILANTFAGTILLNFLPLSQKEMPREGWTGRLIRVYYNKYSLLSVRFMLAFLPGLLAVTILFSWNLAAVSRAVSLVYIAAAVGWLLLCIPNHEAMKGSGLR